MQPDSTTFTFGDPRLPARFWAKVNEHGPIPAHRPDLGPCWEWVGTRNPSGYGVIGVGSLTNGTKTTTGPHRLAYETHLGLVPVGLEIDHLCRNRACVRLSHIEIVTHRENVLRGNGWGKKARQTHCVNGHMFDDINTGRNANGTRLCRACDRDKSRRYRRRKHLTIEVAEPKLVGTVPEC